MKLTLTRLSSPADANQLPSGLNLTQLTQPLWPCTHGNTRVYTGTYRYTQVQRHQDWTWRSWHRHCDPVQTGTHRYTRVHTGMCRHVQAHKSTHGYVQVHLYFDSTLCHQSEDWLVLDLTPDSILTDIYHRNVRSCHHPPPEKRKKFFCLSQKCPKTWLAACLSESLIQWIVVIMTLK